MSQEKPKPGALAWTDLTVPNAETVRQFYESVVGWTSSPVDMDGYQDHCMNTPGGETVAGICHARGVNANLPAQWMVYWAVDDVDASIDRCVALGGSLIDGPRDMGGKCAFIRDPAGAVAALIESKA